MPPKDKASIDTTSDQQQLYPLPAPSTSQALLPRSLSSRSSSIPGPSRGGSSSPDISLVEQGAQPSRRKRRRKNKPVENPAHGGAIDLSASSNAHKVGDTTKSSPPLYQQPAPNTTQPAREPEPLSNYVCPICFSPPTNATLTPCGHICCGQCLFTAVRTTLQRNVAHMTPEPPMPRCPICRAVLKGWDGKGGGVIGLKARTVFSL